MWRELRHCQRKSCTKGCAESTQTEPHRDFEDTSIRFAPIHWVTHTWKQYPEKKHTEIHKTQTGPKHHSPQDKKKTKPRYLTTAVTGKSPSFGGGVWLPFRWQIHGVCVHVIYILDARVPPSFAFSDCHHNLWTQAVHSKISWSSTLAWLDVCQAKTAPNARQEWYFFKCARWFHMLWE